MNSENDNKYLSQRTPEWYSFRQAHIGSSDIPVIMGVSLYNRTPYQLWEEKTGNGESEEVTSSMRRGIDLEEGIRNSYIERTGKIVMPQVLEHPVYSWVSASLDGITEDGKHFVEIKYTNAPLFKEIKKGKIPDHFMFQVQWQYHANPKAETADLVCYNDEEGVLNIPIVSDKELQRKLHEAGLEFMRRIAENDPPPLRNNDYVTIEDFEFLSFLEKWKVKKTESERVQLEEKEAGDLVRNYSNLRNFRSRKAGVKITTVTREGNVEWKKFCKDKDISEEEISFYRKKGIEYKMISVKD